MKIYATGETTSIDELQNALSHHTIHILDSSHISSTTWQTGDIIFDLSSTPSLSAYTSLEKAYIFVAAVKKSLAEQLQGLQMPLTTTIIGINALPTCLSRPQWELSLYQKETQVAVEKLLADLNIQAQFVADRVGMLTPRVIFMIINEACYTLQEGTASIDDINLAMKLGTNYPFGPFEWANQIGIVPVYETLAALYEDTKDLRYKICPLLKNKYLRKEAF